MFTLEVYGAEGLMCMVNLDPVFTFGRIFERGH